MAEGHRRDDSEHRVTQPSARERVVITGLGAITPLGLTAHELWQAILRSESSAGPTTLFEASDLPSRISCEVKGFEPLQYLTRKQVRRLDPVCQFSMAAAHQALADAGLDTETLSEHERDRFGVVFGSGMGAFGLIEDQLRILETRGPNKVSPFFLPMMLPNTPAGMIAIEHDLRGPNHCVVTACATGNHNLADATLLLRHGYLDAVLAGGADRLVRSGTASFAAMKALSTRNDSPETACRPCDRTRDGLVPGEGAGALVLETLHHAEARGARVYAELAGFGASADASHFVQPLADGRGAARAMINALVDAGTDATEVDYINLHATSTPLGDVAETRAIKEVFGDHAGALSLSATKSMTGHLFGAAGAVEAIITALAVFHGQVPPTINLREPDPECDLDYTPGKPRDREIGVAMSNAFGFGGHNSTLVFRRATGVTASGAGNAEKLQRPET